MDFIHKIQAKTNAIGGEISVKTTFDRATFLNKTTREIKRLIEQLMYPWK